jgi:Family of unknown function (DUF6519)
MRGDFTRNTFNRYKHYTRVLMQQGRVQLDADWNEQVAIVRHQLRNMLADLVGPHGGPEGNSGFEIVRDAAGLTGLRGRDGQPLGDARRQALSALIAQGDFVIGSGRYYVDGMLCEIDDPIAFSEQGGYPFDPAGAGGGVPVQGPGLIYLDVWERHVSALEAEQIREIALGGPDTASRAQLVWQVKVLPDATECGAVQALARGRLPLLRAGALEPGELEPCTINPDARYRGQENQLYRVEIHRGGDAGRATFKWSRENGSVAYAIEDIVTDNGIVTVSLASLGRDEYRPLKKDDWVELSNDDTTLRDLPTRLLQVARVDRDTLQAVLHGALDARFDWTPARHPLLRRWDQAGGENGLPVTEAATADDTWIALEDGVQIQFAAADDGAASDYRHGDFWMIPARFASGDIDWPRTGSARAALAPMGVRHYYAPLAVVSIDNGQAQLASCRREFRGLAMPPT